MRKIKEGMQVGRSVCWGGGGCHGGCGVLLYVKDNRLVKVEGDPEFPYNQGRLCSKGLALPQLVHHPDRLSYPLKKVGERGEGKWERISWDEAYNVIFEKLDRIRKDYGPECVIFCRGTGRDISAAISLLANAFGSPNQLCFLSGNACYLPRVACSNIISGGYTEVDASQFFPDRYDNPNWVPPACLIVWGTNPLVANDNGFFGHWIVDCMMRGSKLIVVDPRLTWLASRANIWLQIRPGTDASLALGMLNIIINEELYDKKFVEDWCYGFNALKERVQEYPPSKVANITWIPKEKIVQAARMYAQSQPAAIKWGVGIDMTRESLGAAHAIQSLWIITGNLDIPGSNVFIQPFYGITAQAFGWKEELLSTEQKEKRIGINHYPMMKYMGYTLAHPDIVLEQIETANPYPIKAAWIQTTNPLATAADPVRVYKALKKLEFMVVVDLFLTPTAMLADIVLPAATFAERDSIAAKLGHTFSAINKHLAVGDCKSDAEINIELAKRFNPTACQWDTADQMLDEMLKPIGLTFKEFKEKHYLFPAMEYRKYEKGLLRPDGNPGFNTPTGKCELYSTRLREWGLEPLPYFEEPPESPASTPELLKEYPLILTTGTKTPVYFHSEHRQISWLRKFNPDPIVEIHPDTAGKLGINDGDWVWIESNRGKCKQRAKYFIGIHPRVVSAQHGWWFPERPEVEPSLFGVWDSNINLLIPWGWVGKSGFGNAMKASLCRIYKV